MGNEPTAKGPSTNGESYGCGVCPETFPTLEDAQAHVASVHAEP